MSLLELGYSGCIPFKSVFYESLIKTTEIILVVTTEY